MPERRWTKPPPALTERFARALPHDPAIVRKPMFGCACAFVHGNMFCGLFQDRVLVRVGASEAARRIAAGAADPFTPLPGRTMKEYVLVPPPAAADDARLAAWLGEALAFARGLPPKAAKPRPAAGGTRRRTR